MSNHRRKPLLFTMARRQTPQAGEPVMYDQELDQLLMLENGSWVAAIDAAGGGSKTKKMDVETGEDEKDRW